MRCVFHASAPAAVLVVGSAAARRAVPTVSVIIKSLLLSMGCFSGEDTDVVIAAARSTMNADGGVEEAARPTPKGWRASSNAGTGLVATSASECG
jgi:hypothetical protein